MPAGITETDGMMYVGEKPWHGLGTELPALATAAEAMEAASLNWDVALEPVYTHIPGGRSYKQVLHKMAVVRLDNLDALGVVTPQYKVFQNMEAFHCMDAVTLDPNGAKYVTAGSLWGGRRVWALAKLPDVVEVVPGDTVEEYLLMSTSHDGSAEFSVKWTPIRVVCWNTLQMALAGGGRHFHTRHFGNIASRVHDAQEVLGIVHENHGYLKELTDTMVNQPVTEEQIEQVLCMLFSNEEEPVSLSDLPTRSQTLVEEIKQCTFHGAGADMPGINGTAWQFYNGVTGWADHLRKVGGTGDNRQERKVFSNWWGTSANLKADALRIIQSVCVG